MTGEAHTVDGVLHDGDELDCPFCRERLLEAFRGDVSPVHTPPGPAVPPDPPHALNTALSLFPDQPGGVWVAVCSCGWTRSGRFARSSAIAQITARRVAELWAARHQADPLEDADEEDPE